MVTLEPAFDRVSSRIYSTCVPLEGTMVLVVDDDPDNVDVLEALIGHAGAVVRKATSAKQALVLLSGWTPQVLLLDISMPGMDGVDLLLAIRRRPELEGVPAVAVSALTYSSDKERAFSAGFSAYMTKPYDGPALIELVEWLALPNHRRSSPPGRRSPSVLLP
jgi:CheY-like chemotaxis protein